MCGPEKYTLLGKNQTKIAFHFLKRRIAESQGRSESTLLTVLSRSVRKKKVRPPSLKIMLHIFAMNFVLSLLNEYNFHFAEFTNVRNSRGKFLLSLVVTMIMLHTIRHYIKS